MWQHRSELLPPVSSMPSKQTKWNWNKEHQKAFDSMKKLVSRVSLLLYPNLNKPFEIHTDARKLQLGSVISQKGKPIAFYSSKLNHTQLNQSNTDCRLISSIETLRNSRNILLAQQSKVYTDHKNLTYV